MGAQFDFPAAGDGNERRESDEEKEEFWLHNSAGFTFQYLAICIGLTLSTFFVLLSLANPISPGRNFGRCQLAGNKERRIQKRGKEFSKK